MQSRKAKDIVTMADINLKTDGTLSGTTLSVDGVDQTKEYNIVSISFYAAAPYKSKYSGETVPGWVSCNYEYATDKKTIERKSVGTSDTEYKGSVGEKMESSDSVVRFVGQLVDQAVSEMVDKIVATATEKKIVCPSKEVLLSRTLESLKDKMSDLGILESTQPQNDN